MKKFTPKYIRRGLGNHSAKALSILQSSQHLSPRLRVDEWWWENLQYVVCIYEAP